MEMTLGNHLALEDLPKPGETIYLDGEPLKEGIGNFPDEYGLTATVVKYNTQEEHPFYYGG